jgi:hypothetical protein
MNTFVKFERSDGNTGVAAPSSRGICAIIAPSQSGVANQPTSVVRVGAALTAFGLGPLTEAASYMLATAGNPVVLVKATASTAATLTGIVESGTGTMVPTDNASSPIDDFAVLVEFMAGGTVGTAGITYRASLDNGLSYLPVTNLGVSNTLTIPNSGVSFTLGVGTVTAGDTFVAVATGPRLTSGDISLALEALRVSTLDWEGMTILGHDAVAATVTLVDAWLAARETDGYFRFFMLGARRRGAAESEATYRTAMGTEFATSSSFRGCVGADGGDTVSSVPGAYVPTFFRTAALTIMARTMLVAYGTDPGYVADGPVPGFALYDERGNPKHHDERTSPGLNAIRLSTLTSRVRRSGTYIEGANLISSAGSDYVWIQHARVMNRACEIAYSVLSSEISRGVATSPKKGANGEIYIAEEEALRIDGIVNAALSELRGQVTDLVFRTSRVDNIGSNGPATLNASLEVAALRYIKGIYVKTSFVRSISVQR